MDRIKRGVRMWLTIKQRMIDMIFIQAYKDSAISAFQLFHSLHQYRVVKPSRDMGAKCSRSMAFFRSTFVSQL